MQKGIVWKSAGLLIAAIIVAFSSVGTVMAVTSQSQNYQMTEMQFGAGSAYRSCSDNYCARVMIGDTDINGAGGSTTAVFDDLLDDEPLLEVIIEPGESNLGVLTAEQTATKEVVVRIRHHLTGGYSLQIHGDPPKYDGHTLRALTDPTQSKAGFEQFGINVVRNTTPDVGEDPAQIPDDDDIFGIPEEDYGLSDFFKYTNGDTVARSTTESGRTDYTISMIVNIATSTPAGRYSSDFSAIVIPAY